MGKNHAVKGKAAPDRWPVRRGSNFEQRVNQEKAPEIINRKKQESAKHEERDKRPKVKAPARFRQYTAKEKSCRKERNCQSRPRTGPCGNSPVKPGDRCGREQARHQYRNSSLGGGIARCVQWSRWVGEARWRNEIRKEHFKEKRHPPGANKRAEGGTLKVAGDISLPALRGTDEEARFDNCIKRNGSPRKRKGYV